MRTVRITKEVFTFNELSDQDNNTTSHLRVTFLLEKTKCK